MKFVIFLVLFSLSSIFNTVYANEENASSGDDVTAVCNEQVEMAGLEDADEKAQYIRECLESYGVSSGDAQ